MSAGIPGPLGGLLGKLGLLAKAAPAGKPEGGAAQGLKAAEGEAPPGLPKGALLGEEGALLAGLGYAGEDRHSATRNVAERSAVAKFLHELAEDPRAPTTTAPKEEGPTKEHDADRAEARGERAADDPQATRREEKAEDARAQAREETAKEARREREADEAEGHRERQRDPEEREDEDAHGQGWVAEEQEQEEEAPRRRGLREADALGEAHRCRGLLEDGTRCLRKPGGGASYCPEHALRVPTRLDRA
jgi:hypothetical protein